MWWKKPRNIFKNRGDQIFSKIWQGDDFFQKSRQIITKKIKRGCDMLNKGVKIEWCTLKLEYTLGKRTNHLHKLIELNSDKTSSQNPSPNQCWYPSAFPSQFLEKMRYVCNQKLNNGFFNSILYSHIPFKPRSRMRIPPDSGLGTLWSWQN